MSREQLELRLQELVQQNQIVINGEVEVLKEEMVEDVIEDDDMEEEEETNLLEVSDSVEQ